MVALMVAPVMFVPQLAAWLVMGLCLVVVAFGSVTAPVHVRRLACGLAVAVVVAAGLSMAPSIIYQCAAWWLWPMC